MIRFTLSSMLVLSLSGLARDSAAASKKIGLVLSGGGARGAAHIGVLKVLEREQIPIDCIAGTSFGALVGGFYALGYSPSEIEAIFQRQDWDALFSDAPDRRLSPLFQRKNFRYLAELAFRGARPELPTGLLGGQKLIQELNDITTDRIVAAGYDFDRLRIPFRAVATDLLTGKPYVFRSGRMTEALRASIAIPMIFTPIEKDGMLLVDGGLANNLPADLARDMGADVVIAVDVTSPLLAKDKIRDFFDIVDQTLSLMMKASVDANLRLVDFTLRPDLEPFTYGDYALFADIVPRGARAAEEKLDEIRALTGGRRAPAREPAPPTPAPRVDSVTFSGLVHVGPDYLRRQVRTQAGEQLDVETLHGDLSRLYATRLFERVDYELRPAGEKRYQLNYSFQESPLHTLGASIRYDRDYKFVALAEFNARQVFGTSAAATISSQFGGLENHQAALRMNVPGVRALFVEPGGHMRKRERLDMREGELVDKFTDRRAGGQILFGADLFNRLEITGGFRSERVRIIGGTEPHRESDARRIGGLVLRLARDTLDAQEFPRSGNRTMLQATKLARSFGAEFDYSTWQADVEQYFSVSKVSTLRIGLAAALSHGDVPFYDRFFIGGYNFSDGAARQLLGFQRDEFAARQAAILSASYRRSLFSRPLSFVKHGYATAIYNVAALSDRDRSPYDPKFFNGFGAGIAIDTLMGPMRMVGGWGESGRFRLYLSLGPSF